MTGSDHPPERRRSSRMVSASRVIYMIGCRKPSRSTSAGIMASHQQAGPQPPLQPAGLAAHDGAHRHPEQAGTLQVQPPGQDAVGIGPVQGDQLIQGEHGVLGEIVAAHLGPVGPADAYVFTAEKGGVLRTSNFRIKVWLPAVRAAGLAPLRPHDLRHTAVALWIAAGANPKEVSVRAGHTSVSFTLDRYGHLFPGHDTELRDRLDAMHAEGLQSQVT